MLFEKRTKKIVRIIWGVLGVLLIVSMVVLYMPIF